jgi:hypothetical protein
MNDAARKLGPIQASFVRTGSARGRVTIAMADGGVLHGEYRVAFETAQGYAFSGPFAASSLVIADGPVQFVATGPKTLIICRGTSSTLGHGLDEAGELE